MRLKNQHLKYEPEEQILLKIRKHFMLTAFSILMSLNIDLKQMCKCNNTNSNVRDVHTSSNAWPEIMISVAVMHIEHENKSFFIQAEIMNLAVVLGGNMGVR